jgi:hypothetical protein
MVPDIYKRDRSQPRNNQLNCAYEAPTIEKISSGAHRQNNSIKPFHDKVGRAKLTFLHCNYELWQF